MATPLSVTEWMKGYITLGATSYDDGFIQGIDSGLRFSHEVVISVDDIDRFVEEPRHEARMDGFIECEAFGGKRTVEGGTFNMLLDREDPKLKVMLYRIPFLDASGAQRTMMGHKTIHADRALDMLHDIMTLYIRIFEGDIPGPDISTTAIPGGVAPDIKPIAMGILHIETADAFRSARSFRAPGSGPLQAAEGAAKFGKFYLEGLWKVFGKAMRVRT